MPFARLSRLSRGGLCWLAVGLLWAGLGIGQATACPDGRPWDEWDTQDQPTAPAHAMMDGVSGPGFEELQRGMVWVGAVVRSGDVIDGLTPIYARVGGKGFLTKPMYRGQAIGGQGGGAHLVYKPGHVVVGVRYLRMNYYGHAGIQQMQLVFRKWSPNGPVGPDVLSKTFSPTPSRPDGSTQSVLHVEPGQAVTGLSGNASQYVNILHLHASPVAKVRSDKVYTTSKPVTLHQLRRELRAERRAHNNTDTQDKHPGS